MVGGYDYAENQYNTATMAHRQLGSSVKPYVYLTALMSGATVDKKVDDHPVTYQTASGPWSPKNYGGRYYGTMPLRDLLARSANSVSAQLMAEYGGPDATIRTMRRLGITSKVDRVMPVSVGAVELTLLEHTYAYATIASGGKEMPQLTDSDSQGVFITKVTDRRGDVLYEYKRIEPRQAVPADDAYSLIYLMKGVVEDSSGTGHRVMELSRPAGGKTGTTNDNRDVWFMGYTTDLVVGTWVGTMSPQKIAEKATGGAIALPIWLAFMKAAHPATPAREFPVPPDVSLMLDDQGKPIPFQRGRLPDNRLTPKPQKGFYEDP
jgi:penicillin-binding protein 1A